MVTLHPRHIINRLNKALKNKVRRWAFSDKNDELNRENERQLYEYRQFVRKSIEESKDVKYIVRRALNGFDPTQLSKEEMTISEWVGGADEEEGFLQDMHHAAENDGLRTLANFLIASQVIHIARWAKNEREVEFGRYSINGISLLLEEVDRLNAVYLENVSPEEEYDEHEVP